MNSKDSAKWKEITESYKLKQDIEKSNCWMLKTRLVKVFNQKEGVDYGEIFSSVVRHSSIKMLLSLVVTFKTEIISTRQ